MTSTEQSPGGVPLKPTLLPSTQHVPPIPDQLDPGYSLSDESALIVTVLNQSSDDRGSPPNWQIYYLICRIFPDPYRPKISRGLLAIDAMTLSNYQKARYADPYDNATDIPCS